MTPANFKWVVYSRSILWECPLELNLNTKITFRHLFQTVTRFTFIHQHLHLLREKSCVFAASIQHFTMVHHVLPVQSQCPAWSRPCTDSSVMAEMTTATKGDMDLSPNYGNMLVSESGWWLVYPSEKYEFVNWDDDIPNINGKIKLMATKPPTSELY